MASQDPDNSGFKGVDSDESATAKAMMTVLTLASIATPAPSVPPSVHSPDKTSAMEVLEQFNSIFTGLKDWVQPDDAPSIPDGKPFIYTMAYEIKTSLHVVVSKCGVSGFAFRIPTTPAIIGDPDFLHYFRGKIPSTLTLKGSDTTNMRLHTGNCFGHDYWRIAYETAVNTVGNSYCTIRKNYVGPAITNFAQYMVLLEDIIGLFGLAIPEKVKLYIPLPSFAANPPLSPSKWGGEIQKGSINDSVDLSANYSSLVGFEIVCINGMVQMLEFYIPHHERKFNYPRNLRIPGTNIVLVGSYKNNTVIKYQSMNGFEEYLDSSRKCTYTFKNSKYIGEVLTTSDEYKAEFLGLLTHFGLNYNAEDTKTTFPRPPPPPIQPEPIQLSNHVFPTSRAPPRCLPPPPLPLPPGSWGPPPSFGPPPLLPPASWVPPPNWRPKDA